MPAMPRRSAALASVLEWVAAVEVYRDRRLLFVFLMGFASGLPLLLTGATLSVWLTEAGVTLTAIGLFALVGLPYNLKFVWAPFVDRVPVPVLSALLGRRRAWMISIQLGLMACIVGLGLTNPTTHAVSTAAFAVAVAFFSASQDIVIDAYRIEILDEEQQGAGAAMTQAGYRFGLIAAGAGALYLADAVDWSVVYAGMALLVLVGTVAALFAPIPPATPPASDAVWSLRAWLEQTLAEPFTEFFERCGLGVAATLLAFILLYKFGDAFAGVMANPFYIQIGFSKSEIASVSKVFGIGATLVGVFLGGIVVRRYGVLRSLLICGLLQMFSNLMFAAQAALGADLGFLFLTIGVENLSGGMGSAAFVAYLSLLCNTAYTGTQYALFSSFMALGRTTLAASSGWLADRTDWVSFFVVSTFVALPGLLLLLWMIKRLPMSRQQAAGDG
jgi:PAT family beta-lactamase induction signal transducer AmpG